LSPTKKILSFLPDIVLSDNTLFHI